MSRMYVISAYSFYSKDDDLLMLNLKPFYIQFILNFFFPTCCRSLEL